MIRVWYNPCKEKKKNAMNQPASICLVLSWIISSHGCSIKKRKEHRLAFSKRGQEGKKFYKKRKSKCTLLDPATQGGIPPRPSILEVIELSRASKPTTTGQYLDHPPRPKRSNHSISVCSTNSSYFKLEQTLVQLRP